MTDKNTLIKRADITQTRSNIASELHHKTGLSVSESSNLVSQIFENISDALTRGEDVKLAGFGTFKLLQKAERLGRNPRTKKEVVIKSRQVVSFKPSDIIKKRIQSAHKAGTLTSQKSLKVNVSEPMPDTNLTQIPKLDKMQWIAIFQLLGMLTLDSIKLNQNKSLAYAEACFELKVIHDPKIPITKTTATKWLKTNERSMLVARQSKNDRSLMKVLNQLSNVPFKLDILCLMVRVAIADGQYGDFERAIIKKTILHWDIPVTLSHDIDFNCSDKVLEALQSFETLTA